MSFVRSKHICARGNLPFFHKNVKILFFVGIKLKGKTTLVLEKLMKNCSRTRGIIITFIILLVQFFINSSRTVVFPIQMTIWKTHLHTKLAKIINYSYLIQLLSTPIMALINDQSLILENIRNFFVT